MCRNAKIRILIAAGLLAASGAAYGDPAPPAREVRGIRFWTAPDRTRVVLDMSSESVYQLSERTDPDRIVIDIPRGRFAEGIGAIDVGDGVVLRVRTNALSSGAQIVLDLPHAAPYRHFALRPNPEHPRHRIVIDIDRRISASERRTLDERARRDAQSGDMIVIVDPGHGGSQPGAPSRYGPSEKEYTLPIAGMIAEEISSRPGFRAVLTRTGDYDVDLYDRVRIARDHGGHCFVSVHLNSNRSSRVRGSEVYFLTLEGTRDEHAASVAERENMQLGRSAEDAGIDGEVESI
ncbi:MAG: N-acetylmuramoyl-L-alanine amidase, partial [Candidatus Krumholzibacteria bacterium]|nr:N-acetylmuramoyl-L-alanine amidase [Candidatus Krumholzibacteria bacterium]